VKNLGFEGKRSCQSISNFLFAFSNLFSIFITAHTLLSYTYLNLRKTGITTENHKIFKISHNLLKQTRPKSNPMRKGSSIAGRHSMNPSTGIFI
jgi:hypothetical protein